MRLGRQIDHLANRRLGNLSVVGPELGAACDLRPTVRDADPCPSDHLFGAVMRPTPSLATLLSP
jgi:hypothetical protein